MSLARLTLRLSLRRRLLLALAVTSLEHGTFLSLSFLIFPVSECFEGRFWSSSAAFLGCYLREHLDVVVSMRQLFRQASHLLTQLIYQFDFRVDVLGRFIRDEGGFHSVVERA